jgi:hypothetical protein
MRRPIAFFDELAKNASAHHIPVVIYSGNDDSLIPHWGSEGWCLHLDVRHTAFIN